MDPDTHTLGEVLRATASAQPHKLALVGEGARYTWSSLDQRVDRLAGGLQALGVSKGDLIGLCIAKRPELVLMFLAAARLGALVAPINYKMESAHLRTLFTECSFKLVLLEKKHDDLVLDALSGLSAIAVYVDEVGTIPGALFEEVSAPFGPGTVAVDSQDPVYLNVTSGTTGRPKSAVGTHAQILWNAHATVDALDYRQDDIFLCMFSAFSHPHELFHRSLITGATAVVVDSLNPRAVAQMIDKYRVTWMMAVPAFYEMLLIHLDAGELDLSSLRVLESGGAWVSPDTATRIEQAFDCIFLPVWGSTETHGVVLALLPGESRQLGATGTVIPHYQAEVVDRHGRPVEPGGVGELVVSGPGVATHYFRQPEASSAYFRDGKYFTGDLVRRDESGNFWFVGRKNDLMKVGGIRVFPLEIEKAVGGHPAVAEVSVVRANERVRGEIPRAVVCLHSGASLSSNELKAWCRRHLAVYKVPRIVEFWNELPRLPNGKINRKEIEATPVGRVA